MSADSGRLRRVTLTYCPHRGYPREAYFDHLTPADLGFVLATLHSRMMREDRSDSGLDVALEEVREDTLHWYANQVRQVVGERLGWWGRWVPARVRERVVAGLTERFSMTLMQWAADLAELYGRVDALHGRVAAVRNSRVNPAGPQILCGYEGCMRGMPLQPGMPLPPDWSWDMSGKHKVPRCPEHPVERPAQAESSCRLRESRRPGAEQVEQK